MSKENNAENRLKNKESFRFSPMDFLGKKCHMEIDSNKSVVFEGSKGVLEYSNQCIRVSADSFIVSFEGVNLALKCISPTALTIEGSILSISFSD